MSTAAAAHSARSTAIGTRTPAVVVNSTYTCPGETHPISRAVHYARLASFYPLCRECVHRHDAGHLPRPFVERLEQTTRSESRETPAARESIRGVYLNEFTRPLADRYAAAFAELLWKRQPLQARISRRATAESRVRGPIVVVAQDDRPTAPDLVVGVAAALRRMGCQVIDVGTVSTPCFWCAVDHLQAAGGVYVTGQGRGPAGIGLDFVGAGGIPWSRTGSLDQLEDSVAQPLRRTSRNGGSLRSFRISVPYEAGLLKHFQTLGPLHIGVCCLASTVAVLLDEFLSSLPCRLEIIAAPVADDVPAAIALASHRLAEHVREEGLQAGVLLGDDGQSCTLFDERGVAVSAGALAVQLSELVSRDSKSPTIVLDKGLGAGPADALTRLGYQVVPCDGTRESMARSLTATDAGFGCDAADRFWFRDAHPRCDALVTLARILHLLSGNPSPPSSFRAAGREGL